MKKKQRISRFFQLLPLVSLAGMAGLCGTACEKNSQAIPEDAPGAAPASVVIRDAAMVITMDPTLGAGPLGIIENADVVITDDRITEVGQDLTTEGTVVVDATGKIVLPGFVDVHNHLWQSLIRGCGTDKDLIGWLDECVFPFYANPITDPEAYAGVRLSTYDLIDTGVTTVVDDSHSYHEEFVQGNLRALDDSGLRYVYAYCGRINTFDHMRAVKADIDTKPLAGFQVCSHPGQGLLDWLTDTTQLAKELDVYLNLHLNENITQRADEAVAAMTTAGSFTAKLLVNHAIHMTPEEIQMLADSDARVAHNPLSNMRLASGIFPMAEMRAAGIKIGLGLDGGTNDTSDVFANMKAAVGLQRVKLLDATASPTVVEVLRMATLGGAEVLDMQNEIGSLTPGKKADVIVFNPNTTNVAPRWDWLSQIVFNGQPRNVEHVFVDGKALKSSGQVVGADQEQIRSDAEVAAARLKAVLEALP